MADSEPRETSGRELDWVRMRTPQTIDVTGARGDLDGLLNLWHVLVERKWLILALALLGALVGIGVTLPQPILYRARATLEVQIFNENFLGMGQMDPQAGSYSPTDANIRTHMQVLKSTSLRREVTARLERETIPSLPPNLPGRFFAVRRWAAGKFYGTAPSDPVDAMRQGLRMSASTVDARNAAGTRIIEITSDSTHPELAANFVNALVNEFIDQSLMSRLKSLQRTSQWMRAQVEELRGRLEKSEERLQQFIRDNGGIVPVMTEQDAQAQLRIMQVEQALAAVRSERTAKQASHEMASSGPLEDLVLTPEGSGLRPAYTRLADMRKQLAELNEKYTPAHARVRKQIADIADLETSIQRERDALVIRLRKDFEDAQQREKTQAAFYSRAAQSQTTRPDKLMEYSLLKRQVDNDRQLYQAMLQNINQAGLASAMPANNLRVIDAAEASLQSTNDGRMWTINISLGMFTGLLLAVAWSVMRVKTNRRVQNPGEVSSLLNVPELGVIPSSRIVPARWRVPFLTKAEPAGDAALEEREQQVEMVTWSQKPSLMAESFRGMRASLFGALSKGIEPKMLVVTSPGPRDGKSTVASNLAISLAEAHRRVLLIDGDLRSPRLHTIFELANDCGLGSLMEEEDGRSPVADTALHSTRVPGLWVLPSGPTPGNVGGLFYSSRLRQLLERMRRSFDHVIIDTPPLLLFADARVLGRLADGVLLVLRAGTTDQASAMAARQRLSDDGIPLLGAILNDWDASKQNTYGHYNYHRYQSK